jgi:hypothetical protein
VTVVFGSDNLASSAQGTGAAAAGPPIALDGNIVKQLSTWTATTSRRVIQDLHGCEMVYRPRSSAVRAPPAEA